MVQSDLHVVRDFFERLGRGDTDAAFELLQEQGRSIVMMRVTGRGATSGIDVALEAAVLYRVEDGRIIRIQPFRDLDSVREALSPRPSA